MQPAITSGIPLGSANSQYAAPQAYVNLAAAIVSTEGNCRPFSAASTSDAQGNSIVLFAGHDTRLPR